MCRMTCSFDNNIQFQGSTRSGGGGRRAANGQGRQPPQQQHQPIQRPIVQNSLLDYFSTNPKPDFGEVDIDAALQDEQIMNGFGDHGVPVIKIISFNI
jgi:hypothetical protein